MSASVELLGMAWVKQQMVRGRRASGRCGGGRGEAISDAPQHRLRAAGDIDLSVNDIDLPVNPTDVGLHRVGAQDGQYGHFGVAFALRDQGQDF
jgi:hypothetical protein